MTLLSQSLAVLCLLTTAPAFAGVPFIVGDNPYHCGSDQISKPTYTINFAEFADTGAPFCSSQLTHALDQIDKARADSEKIVVLVYIHGWKNDANETYSADVGKFQNEVDRLSLILKQPGGGRQPPMVGIYLAWRGLTLSVEPFKTISYWPRRAAAHHVGQTGIDAAVGAIVERVGRERARTTLIFVGHSFGARVLENAADAAVSKPGRKPGFMWEHLQTLRSRQSAMKSMPLKDRAIHSAPPVPPADMIIYVNAASASTVTRRTIKEWDRLCKEGSDSPVCSAHPFWLSFTSTGDFATGFIMPVANAVFPALTSDGLHLISAANTPSLHTHRVLEHKAGEADCPESQKPTDYDCPPGVNADACFGGIRDTRINPAAPMPNFWIMNVNRHVVKDHGDIWNNETVINFILGVMTRQTGTVNELRDRLLNR